ncbi:helix-turn-helix transcriptional regulator (plasmid) [Macrococcus psychrotolerans]|uniref:Helix-turn-helix transcriptional regulator n=1 Tax=Macrococcus psychrotolerans TaxID=3039389 RepID=A0AAT9P9M7_9STAP|nr:MULTISPECIES: helix-turn-helix transcriptional regulator [Macrococcus]QYA34083.1 helix-turn-helix domain-containing protein [Macrococcus sp. 19Msa1099]QYA38868.1 helix-turn-helix domain-containing protein [Macrococcus caseolyticus]QYA77591.1 helix-turn-helix domain-containing protein [Macrococcus caseolyticus]
MLYEVIEAKRKEQNITRSKLCKNVCSPSTLYRFEKGELNVSLDIFTKWCEKLKIENINLISTKMYLNELNQFDIAKEAIYYNDFESLEYLINSSPTKKNSYFFTTKLHPWMCAVYYFNIGEIDKSKTILKNICPHTKINSFFDFNVLNSLALVYILNKEWYKAKEILNKCINNSYFKEISDINIEMKVKYNLAYCHFYLDNIYDCIDILENLVYLNKKNTHIFMMGKIYYFLYLCYKKLNNDKIFREYLKLAYFAFYIEDPQSIYISKNIIPTLKEEGITIHI